MPTQEFKLQKIVYIFRVHTHVPGAPSLTIEMERERMEKKEQSKTIISPNQQKMRNVKEKQFYSIFCVF